PARPAGRRRLPGGGRVATGLVAAVADAVARLPAGLGGPRAGRQPPDVLRASALVVPGLLEDDRRHGFRHHSPRTRPSAGSSGPQGGTGLTTLPRKRSGSEPALGWRRCRPGARGGREAMDPAGRIKWPNAREADRADEPRTT